MYICPIKSPLIKRLTAFHPLFVIKITFKTLTHHVQYSSNELFGRFVPIGASGFFFDSDYYPLGIACFGGRKTQNQHRHRCTLCRRIAYAASGYRFFVSRFTRCHCLSAQSIPEREKGRRYRRRSLTIA